MRKKPTLANRSPTTDNDAPLWTMAEPFARMSDECDRIVSYLKRAPLPENLDPLRTRALSKDTDRTESARSALAIGRACLQENFDPFNDVAYSWVWYADHQGSVIAGLMLASALVSRARLTDSDGENEDPKAASRAKELFSLGLGNPASKFSDNPKSFVYMRRDHMKRCVFRLSMPMPGRMTINDVREQLIPMDDGSDRAHRR